jgi:hypothetical protein
VARGSWLNAWFTVTVEAGCSWKLPLLSTWNPNNGINKKAAAFSKGKNSGTLLDSKQASDSSITPKSRQNARLSDVRTARAYDGLLARYTAFFAGLRELPIVDILSPTTPAPWRGGEGNFWGVGNTCHCLIPSIVVQKNIYSNCFSNKFSNLHSEGKALSASSYVKF